MPILETKSPGVFGFEKAPARAPEGISPGKASFVGWTDQGPSATPVEVRSFQEFERVFGNISTLGLVPIEVHAYFATGGERCYIVRTVAADAVNAQVEIDPSPGPVKWTFISNGEGLWGNDTTIRVRGNRNFLDRTPGSEAWQKFDVLILRPSDFDDNILEAKEQFNAIQFSDPDGGDYITLVIMDPRRPSTLVTLVEGAGGVPSGLLGTTITDEIVVAGALVDGILTQFSGTLAAAPLLDGTLRIVASDAVIDDEVQTPTPAIDGALAGFNFTLALGAALDGSLRLFFAKVPDIVAEAPAVTGVIDSANTTYTIAPSALANPVHKESAVFNIRYSATAPSSPETLFTDVGGITYAHDLSTTPPSDIPVHPGTVSIAFTTVTNGAQVVLDDGAGNLIANPLVLPAGGTINYATGALTGVTALDLVALSTIVATYNISSVITKAAVAAGDNMELGTALAGALGAGTNTIDHVNSLTTPTGNGLIDFETATAPITGTVIYVDYVALGIVESSIAGVLTGDIGVPGVLFTNTVDFSTGVTSVIFDVAPKLATTIDADYQSGQVATDDGLGRLVGDVDPTGANTIDYTTGAWDLTWDSPPVATTDILGNYANLASFVDYPLVGGLDGAAVSRADISAAALEVSRAGIYALDLVEEPLNVVVPDFEGSEFVQFDLVQFARARSDSRYLIMGFANGTTTPEAIQYNLVTQAWDEKIGALYYPNIFYVNPVTDRAELIPVTGFAAGVFAKTANNKNIGKSPGGILDGALDGVGTVGPEITLDLAQRDDLYQSRINPIINSQATGLAVWGVRGLSKEDRWQYVNARQLHNFLMYSISLNLQWAVFENNGPPLWVRIETALKGYFGSLFRLGFFQGETEEEAFFVKCNATNNNVDTVAAGKAIIDIGFTPNTPAEFIIFTLQQPVGQTTATV